MGGEGSTPQGFAEMMPLDIIDLLLNIRICALLNYIKCSKCPPLT